MRNATAHVRSGRLPDPNALRRDRSDDGVSWLELPEAGRTGDSPLWPFGKPTARELALWRSLWTTSQAVGWEASHSEHVVASYVRALMAAQSPSSRAADRTVLLRYQDALGLTEAGLRANRWRIAGRDPAPAVTQAGNVVRLPARERFRLIELERAEHGQD